ncbi:ankyrin repeat containing protein [Phlyctema vagabunda]|uniref:Ankyrin repeat containing protein n=1 Tax=Phlyctema vagabunda TaxID=108571 RepID=A0ABR4P937_9HELO
MELQSINKCKRTAELDWLTHRAIIKKRYMDDKISLKTLRSEMESTYGFIASKAQYEAQLNAWGFKKKMKREDWAFIKHKIEARNLQREETVVYFHNNLIDPKSIEREIKRNVSLSSSYLKTAFDQTPAGLFISSPGRLILHGIRVENLPYYHTKEILPTYGIEY